MCLEAADYFSALGMTWDAALKMANVKLELFTNEDLYVVSVNNTQKQKISNVIMIIH